MVWHTPIRELVCQSPQTLLCDERCLMNFQTLSATQFKLITKFLWTLSVFKWKLCLVVQLISLIFLAFAKYLFITTNRLFDNFQFQIRWFQDHHSRVRFSSELLLSLRSDGDLWFASRIDNKNNSITCCGVLSTNRFNYIVNWYCETDTYAQRDYSLKLQVHRKQSRAHRRWPGLR